MRGPICVANRDDETSDELRIRDVYLRRPWRKLFSLWIFRKWDCIMFGETTGIELNIGKFHFEFQHRSKNA